MVLAAADPPPEATPPMTPGQIRRLAARRAAATAAASRPKPTRDLAPSSTAPASTANVKIFEADKPVATADRLEIDILQPPQEDPATKPATADDSAADATTRAVVVARRVRRDLGARQHARPSRGRSP